MGLLPESGNPEDVSWFKIDEATYDPKTVTWGSDWLMKNKSSRTTTIPSDIKPGTYVVRHEIISLHNALNDDFNKKSSGAQFYPSCIKVKVTGSGTATPPGGKFPGLYKWDEKGILVNIFYRANEYFSPGGPVYKPANPSPPVGPRPVVDPSLLSTGQTQAYTQQRSKSDSRWVGAVHSTDAGRKLIPICRPLRSNYNDYQC
jgi:cellulase